MNIIVARNVKQIDLARRERRIRRVFDGKNSCTNLSMCVKLKSSSKSALHYSSFIAIVFMQFWTILSPL